MIPGQYATATAVIFVAVGLLACFAGFRVWRVVLGVYGFIAGVMLGSSIAGSGNTLTMVLGALVGGVVGAIVMVLAYFVAVGLVGAGLAAMAVHLIWKVIGGEPPTLVLVVACVIGAVLALQVQRIVGIVGTAIAGAWTAVVGGLALMGDPKALVAASAPNVWVVYPNDLVPADTRVLAVWVALAVAGVVVQMKTTTTTGKKKRGV